MDKVLLDHRFEVTVEFGTVVSCLERLKDGIDVDRLEIDKADYAKTQAAWVVRQAARLQQAVDALWRAMNLAKPDKLSDEKL